MGSKIYTSGNSMGCFPFAALLCNESQRGESHTGLPRGGLGRALVVGGGCRSEQVTWLLFIGCLACQCRHRRGLEGIFFCVPVVAAMGSWSGSGGMLQGGWKKEKLPPSENPVDSRTFPRCCFHFLKAFPPPLVIMRARSFLIKNRTKLKSSGNFKTKFFSKVCAFVCK